MVLLIDNDPSPIEYHTNTNRPFYQLNDKVLQDHDKHICDCQMYKNNTALVPTCSICSVMKKEKPIRKKLRFASDVQVTTVAGWRDMSRREHKATWYRKKEYKKIRQANDSISDIDIEDSVELSKNGRHTLRGLEHLIDRKYSATRNQMRRALFRAVLGAQTRQRMMDYVDPEKISATSSSISRRSRNLAHAIGEADAAFVRSWRGESFSCNSTRDNEPEHKSFSRADMGVIEYILSESGIDMKLYGYIDRASNQAKKAIQQKKSTVLMNLGEYLRCGLFARWKNETTSMVTFDPYTQKLLASCAIYDVDGKRLWSWQSQLSSHTLADT